jgi:NADH-quinone oxidoreductase subunit G
MIQVEIDGQKILAQEGDSIIEVADKHGIYIPRYCYHKMLSVAANCRMCLVEVDKSKKPVPACATPVSDGMKIFTQSQLALEAQRDVMGFLLINHPLDCPVCDQGGECELQDLAMGFGRAQSDYDQTKRAVQGPELGPLIQTFMTRCIQCTRCVRFGEEIAGKRELGVMHRSEHEAISVAIEGMMESEVSGNIIDICPVGALTAKPVRFTGRSWSYYEHPYIAPHDCIGSHVYMHTLRNDNAQTQRVMRVVPKEEPAINECWISDRDRFGFMGIHHTDRATEPLLKIKGKWETVSWERLLSEVSDRLCAIKRSGSADHLAGLISPHTTVEEQYLFQKLIRQLGSNHVDSRLRTQDFSDQFNRPLQPGLGRSLESFAASDAIVVIGGDIRREQPVLICRLNQTQEEQERSIYLINSYDTEPTFQIADQSIVSRHELVPTVASLLGAVKVEKGEKLSSDWAKITIRPEHTVWAKKLVAAKNPVIVLGEQVETLMQSSSLRACAFELAKTLGTELGEFTAGPNTAGAWFTGCVSHRGPLGGSVDPGDNALDLFTGSRKKAYFLYQVEPEYDSVVPAHALQALRDAELVIVASSFVTDEMKDYADFILPVATFAEMPGTFINIEGKAQSFKAATMPHGHVRPGWKVLRVLSNFCHLDGFEQRTIDEVRQEIHAHSIVKASFTLKWDTAELKQGVSHLTRLSVHPAALADSIARRSSALQETVLPNDRKAAANSKTASALGLTDGCQVRLKQGSSVIELALRIDDKLASQMIFVPAGIAETKGFGRLESEIEVERIGG